MSKIDNAIWYLDEVCEKKFPGLLVHNLKAAKGSGGTEDHQANDFIHGLNLSFIVAEATGNTDSLSDGNREKFNAIKAEVALPEFKAYIIERLKGV